MAIAEPVVRAAAGAEEGEAEAEAVQEPLQARASPCDPDDDDAAAAAADDDGRWTGSAPPGSTTPPYAPSLADAAELWQRDADDEAPGGAERGAEGGAVHDFQFMPLEHSGMEPLVNWSAPSTPRGSPR
jgi:hypothetical protein